MDHVQAFLQALEGLDEDPDYKLSSGIGDLAIGVLNLDAGIRFATVATIEPMDFMEPGLIDVSCNLWVKKGTGNRWKELNEFGAQYYPAMLTSPMSEILITGGQVFEIEDVGEWDLTGVCGKLGLAEAVEVVVDEEPVKIVEADGGPGRFFCIPVLTSTLDFESDVSIVLREVSSSSL